MTAAERSPGPTGPGRHRVVLTGLGVVSSIGLGVQEFLQGLREGRSGARPISLFDTEGFAHANGCEITGFDPGTGSARWTSNSSAGPRSSRPRRPGWHWRTRASTRRSCATGAG